MPYLLPTAFLQLLWIPSRIPFLNQSIPPPPHSPVSAIHIRMGMGAATEHAYPTRNYTPKKINSPLAATVVKASSWQGG